MTTEHEGTDAWGDAPVAAASPAADTTATSHRSRKRPRVTRRRLVVAGIGGVAAAAVTLTLVAPVAADDGDRTRGPAPQAGSVADVTSVLPAATVAFTELEVGTPDAPVSGRDAMLTWITSAQPWAAPIDVNMPSWAGSSALVASVRDGDRLIPVLGATVADAAAFDAATKSGAIGASRSGDWVLLTPDPADADKLAVGKLSASPHASSIPSGASSTAVGWMDLQAMRGSAEATTIAASYGLTDQQMYPDGVVLAGTGTRITGKFTLPMRARKVDGGDTSWLTTKQISASADAVKAAASDLTGYHYASGPVPTQVTFDSRGSTAAVSAADRSKYFLGNLFEAGAMNATSGGKTVGTESSFCPAVSEALVECQTGAGLVAVDRTVATVRSGGLEPQSERAVQLGLAGARPTPGQTAPGDGPAPLPPSTVVGTPGSKVTVDPTAGASGTATVEVDNGTSTAPGGDPGTGIPVDGTGAVGTTGSSAGPTPSDTTPSSPSSSSSGGNTVTTPAAALLGVAQIVEQTTLTLVIFS